MIFQSHSRQCFQEIDSPEFEPMFSNPNSHIFTASNLVCVGGVGGWGGRYEERKKEREPLHYIGFFRHAYFLFKNLSPLEGRVNA